MAKAKGRTKKVKITEEKVEIKEEVKGPTGPTQFQKVMGTHIRETRSGKNVKVATIMTPSASMLADTQRKGTSSTDLSKCIRKIKDDN